MPSSPSSSKKKKKKKPKPLIQESPVPEQPYSGSRRRARRAHSCSMSTLTRSTTSSLTLGSEWDSTFDMSSMKSSLSSMNSGIYSPLPCGRNSATMLTQLNDRMASPYHQPMRDSTSSLYSDPETTSHTRESSTSLGESSLSSFLSVLLEDEEAAPREISIVSDNPKPEQHSVRELRLSFIRSATKNDKPKCRWDYLTRDNNDREHLARSRRKSNMETRSASFNQFDQITSSMKLRKPTRSCSASTKGTTASEKARKKSKEGMFLRMPVRKGSPNSETSKKKTLMSRVNMSDTDLLLLPIQPVGHDFSPPKMARRRSSLKSNGSSHSRKSNRSSESLKSSGSRNRSNSSFHSDIDDDEDDVFRGNARWTKADTTRTKKSNKLLGGLLVPPSPIPSPAVPSKENASMGKAQRQLTNNLSNHMRNASLLGLSSESDEEDLKDDDSTTIPTRKVKRTSSRKKVSRRASGSLRSTRSGSSLKRTKSGGSLRSTNRSVARNKSGGSLRSSNHSVASTKSGSSMKSDNSSKRGSSNKSSSSRKSRSKSPGALKSRSKSPGALKSRARSKSPGPLKSRKTPEKCDARPPKLPTRFANSPPFVAPTSPTKSPKPLKKKRFNYMPVSPKKNKVAIAPITEGFPIEIIPKPKMAPTKTGTSPKLSSHSRKSPKMSSHSRKKQSSPEIDRSPIKPRRGRWVSPFDGKNVPYSSTHSRTTVPYESSDHSRSTVPYESSTHSRSTVLCESSTHSRYSFKD